MAVAVIGALRRGRGLVKGQGVCSVMMRCRGPAFIGGDEEKSCVTECQRFSVAGRMGPGGPAQRAVVERGKGRVVVLVAGSGEGSVARGGLIPFRPSL